MSLINSQTCQLEIDNKPFSFAVDGVFFTEDSGILFEAKDNIIEHTDWFEQGYSIIDTFSNEAFEKLNLSIKKQVIIGLQKAGVHINDIDNFDLDKYHLYATDDNIHLKVIDHTRNLSNNDFDLDFDNLEQQFSEAVGKQLSSEISELGKSHIQIRINRPNSLDINPPHRDSYLSYYKDILNIWIPISGCNKNSSLPVVPKSHLIAEKDITRTKAKGATINGNTYYVPCISKTSEGELKMIRPNPNYGQSLIFTPFLIHGAAFNGNKNSTRIALELRFEKK